MGKYHCYFVLFCFLENARLSFQFLNAENLLDLLFMLLVKLQRVISFAFKSETPISDKEMPILVSPLFIFLC